MMYEKIYNIIYFAFYFFPQLDEFDFLPAL